MRRFVAELERRVVESDAEIEALRSEKCELARRCEQLTQATEAERAAHALELSKAERERELLGEENERERQMHAVLRDKLDEMTRKFDT